MGVRVFIKLGAENGVNPLSPELNPICYLLALLAYHFFSMLAG
jgi:transposase